MCKSFLQLCDTGQMITGASLLSIMIGQPLRGVASISTALSYQDGIPKLSYISYQTFSLGQPQLYLQYLTTRFCQPRFLARQRQRQRENNYAIFWICLGLSTMEADFTASIKGSPPHSPGRKVTAASLSACISCRSMHLKCDKLLVCFRCSARGIKCVYLKSRLGYGGPGKNSKQASSVDSRSNPNHAQPKG